MRAGRIAKMAGIVLVGLVVLTIAAVLLVLPSHWFRDKVRQRLVETVETATGGRVEIGSFEFDWKRLRAEVKPFVIHGTEPAGRSPLLRAESVAVELKIVSLFARDINVQSLEVAAPRVYLMVYPDGRTNVPEPKVKRRGQGTVVEDILDLAVGRFLLENGVFEVESRGQTTFDARGRNLNARFLYEPSGPRYRAELSVQPLELEWPGHETVPVGVTMALAIEKNRIGLTSARLTNGETVVDASGAVENLASPRGAFQYDARVSVAGVARLIHAAELRRGTVRVTGRALWAGSSNYTATGEIHGTGIEYRDSVVGLSGFRVDGALSAGARGVDLSRIRLAGNVGCPSRPAPECFITAAEGRIAAVALHGRDIDLRSVALTALGGTFNGEAQLRALDRYSVAGNVSGLEARRVVAVYSRYHLPWDALVSGSVSLDGSLRRPADLKATAGLTIDPAAEGAAVHGRITAAYEALGRTIDLGRSTEAEAYRKILTELGPA